MAWFILQPDSQLMYETLMIKQSLPLISSFVSESEFFKYVGCIPIGSVDYVQTYATIHGIKIPKFESYPKNLHKFLYTKPKLCTFDQCKVRDFVYPIHYKSFTGGCKRKLIGKIKPNTKVWSFEPVCFLFKLRFYVAGRMILGYGRADVTEYEMGETDFKEAKELVNKIMSSFKHAPIGYAIDVGCIEGQWYLAGLEDAWSLQFFSDENEMTVLDYTHLVAFRWMQLSCKSVLA